jgi:hypothetical protein
MTESIGSRASQEKIVAAINAYWNRRGTPINCRIEEVSDGRAIAFHIVSDAVNGLPIVTGRAPDGSKRAKPRVREVRYDFVTGERV